MTERKERQDHMFLNVVLSLYFRSGEISLLGAKRDMCLCSCCQCGPGGGVGGGGGGGA